MRSLWLAAIAAGAMAGGAAGQIVTGTDSGAQGQVKTFSNVFKKGCFFRTCVKSRERSIRDLGGKSRKTIFHIKTMKLKIDEQG